MRDHQDSSGGFAERNQRNDGRICPDFKAKQPLLDSRPRRLLQRRKRGKSGRRSAA